MEITYPDSDRLVVDGCRRLTGPSLVWSETGAILDVLVDDMEMERVLECWHRQLDLLLSQVNWENPKLTHRRFENGFNLLIAAPIDQLYSAVLVLETAWYFCACELLELEAESRDRLIEDIREQMLSEKNDALIELQTAAGQHEVDFLVDDDVVSIGHGQGSISYMVEQIPQPQQINWASVHDVPVAMITGTNGKSTSVRLLDGIARAAGQVSGVTSTDFVRVGDDVLDQGDYSGPGGARLLLRDPRLEVAFLEVARGGPGIRGYFNRFRACWRRRARPGGLFGSRRCKAVAARSASRSRVSRSSPRWHPAPRPAVAASPRGVGNQCCQRSSGSIRREYLAGAHRDQVCG